VQNFLSAASGMVGGTIAIIRGLAGTAARNIGNLWVEMTRALLLYYSAAWSC